MRRHKLIELRNKNNMTHEDVAKAIGISRSYYGFIENGTRNPSYNVATKLASLYHSTLKELFPEMIFFGNRCYDKKQSTADQETETA
ncbi:helix-turn-helix transcriptional regulator [Thermoanaerobacterium thermosaccharolyticum]|uniref:helix-turn-helix transcriptional regulator n=1 Tax=Thermoanaerobacterium thermosaccharolyticum TaxID=1517 RepID=UPI003D2C8057